MKNDPATPNPESNDCPNTPAKGQGPPFEADGMNLGCRECSQPIPSARGQKKQTRFCSDECRLRFWRKRKASGFRQTSKTVAEIHRLMATADLMKRGFEVFRSLSSNYSCDLAAYIGGRWVRVVIRAGYAAEGGGAVPLNKPPDGAFDLLAIVTSLGVYYQPPLESLKVHADN